MKQKIYFYIAFLLSVAGMQTADAQGFRVYKCDGTFTQYSLRADSIVFFDGDGSIPDIGGEKDFGPFTPINQYVVGTWYISANKSVTFNEDGTTDYPGGATYRYLPCQSMLVVYGADGVPVDVFKVLDAVGATMVVSSLGGKGFSVWSSTESTSIDEHEWVDLGLPSGTLWATCNVGANSPEEYGDYFAWGETEPKDTYTWNTYKWMNAGLSSWSQISKYTISDNQTDACWYSNGVFVGDGLTELLPEDDAATKNWGAGWQMPSIAQIQELKNSNYTITTWTTQKGINGEKITSKSNGNSIFLPTAGYRDDTGILGVDSDGYYWSRSIYSRTSSSACYLYFRSDYLDWYFNNRRYGQSIRPVRKQ